MNILKTYKFSIYRLIINDLDDKIDKFNKKLFMLLDFINPELNNNYNSFETTIGEMEDCASKQKLLSILEERNELEAKRDQLDSVFYNDGVTPLFETLMKNKEYMSHVSDDTIKKLASNKEITLEEYKELRANSYERKLLIEKLDNEALEYSIDLSMKNTSVPNHASFVPTTYEEALIHTYVPELLRRLKNARIF